MEVPAPPEFESDDAYEASLRDASFWAPYAKAALRSAGLDDGGEVRTHFPTTHVAALVDDRYLVKLHYEGWFGEDCFQTEREAYQMLAHRDLPVPRLLHDGALYGDQDEWRWPFLVMTAMRGRPLRAVDGATDRDLQTIAAFIGSALRKIHDTPVVDGEYVSFALYEDLISIRMARCHRDHETWGSLPERLRPAVRDYVWAAEDLIDPDREHPVLIHGDLHGGNIFVEGAPGSLQPVGIVDFNDVYEGDRSYDLVAIHTKALGCDKALLRVMLDAYAWPELDRGWPRRMMALTLAHDFDMVEAFAARIPPEVRALDELATLVWDLDAPGLPPADQAA